MKKKKKRKEENPCSQHENVNMSYNLGLVIVIVPLLESKAANHGYSLDSVGKESQLTLGSPESNLDRKIIARMCLCAYISLS